MTVAKDPGSPDMDAAIAYRVRQARAFLCDHRALDIVRWNPATGAMTFRCRSCDKEADSLKDFDRTGGQA